MGCTDSKENLTPEELAILNGELRLMYHIHNVNDVDLAYRKYSKAGQINNNQWEDISSKLKLSIYQETPPEAIKNFYSSLKTGESFNLKDLLVVGIYLSTGSASDKARLLFEAYDESDEKILSKGEVQKLANFIIELAVEKTNVLMLEDDPNKVNKDEYAKFIQKLKSVKNKGKTELLKMFMGGDIAQQSLSKQKFIENLSTPSTVTLLTLQGVRGFLKKQEVTAGKFSALTSLKKTGQTELNSKN